VVLHFTYLQSAHTYYILVSLPVFSIHPNDVTTYVYNDIALTCEVGGFGRITIFWKKIGSKLPITATRSDFKSGDSVSSTLRITRTNGYYAGQYYCIAENSAGNISSRIATLRVTGTEHMYYCVHICVCQHNSIFEKSLDVFVCVYVCMCTCVQP